MSSNQTRLKAAFDRLVKSNKKWDEIEAKIEAAKNRGDQAGAGAKAASQGEQEKICCDGSTAPPNAGSEERDPDSASQTGLDPNDPARLTSGDGTLSGVTDCSTGDPVCMDGSGFIPPDGWDAPDEPPTDPDFEEGTYWRADYYGGSCDDTAYVQTCDQGKDFVIERALACRGFTLTRDDLTCGQVFNDYYISSQSCSSVYQSVCDDPPPTETAWPSDGCVNLALKSGTIVGSKYDPDQSGSYSTPKDSIRLCDASNGTEILYQPLPGGGFRTIESSAGAAISGAVGYTYSADGTLTGTITQAEWDATAP